MGIYVDENYSSNDFYRPTDEINPALKQDDPKYSLEMSQYIYSEFAKGDTAITPGDIERFNRTKLYSEGRQDTSIYKDMLLSEFKHVKEGPEMLYVNEDGQPFNKTSRKGFMNVNFDDVFSPAPHFMSKIIGIFEGQDHNIVTEAIDENSIAQKEQEKYKALVKGRHAKFLQRMDNLMGIDYQEEGVLPANEKELMIFDSLGAFKLKYEIGLQKALSHTFLASKLPKLKRQIIKDLIIFGYAATVDYFDYNTGEVRIRRHDPANLILERSKDPTFDDISYFAYIDYVTLFQLKHETGLSDKDLHNISMTFAGKLGNAPTYEYIADINGDYDFYRCRVPVLKSTWKSNDYEYRTRRTNNNGETIDFVEPYKGRKTPKVYDKDKRKTYRVSAKSLYHASWVIGTEIVYDFGKVHDVGFDYKEKEVPLGIHVYHIEEKPIFESCIPALDQIELTFLRLQNGIAQASPPGIAVEYNSLMGMTFENDEWQPLDMLRLKSQTGNIIFSVSPNGVEIPPNYPFPITELKGGLGTVIDDCAKSFELAYNNLRIATGIDDITSSLSTPTQQQGKAVTELAVSATGNTLKPVYAGYLSIKESMAQSALLRIQGLVYSEQESVYTDIIGEQAVEVLKSVGNKMPIQLGVHAYAAPDDMLKQEVRLAAQGAMAGGKNGIPALKYSEYLFIIESLNTMQSVNYARMYIAMKESQREQEERQFALDSQKAQAEGVMAQNEQKAQAEMMKLEKEKERILIEIEAKKNADLELEAAKHQFKLEEIRLQNATKPVTNTPKS